MSKYDCQAVEHKWQVRWEQKPFKTRPTGSGKKYYCLDMFPYPSGSGLHVGHWRGYVLSDVYARIKWLEGYNVLHPMGWDAFGLPAENDAIKKGIHPAISTARNIAHFIEQLKQIGAIYDWDKEINTTDPNYYKWTQWIFLQMYKAGLAYEATVPINWCPSCLTGLANEEVINGACERCGTPVVQKNIRQWMLKITDYAEKLLEGLDRLAWPEKVKLMQRNWIGKSEGALIMFQGSDLEGKNSVLPVYTTCPETIFGVRFLVMAPDHDLVEKVIAHEEREAVADYREFLKTISAQELAMEQEKDGVFTGSYATNPVTQELIPIYLASYVLKNYGTGIVMGVPGHDERDFEFAVAFDLPRPQVIDSPEAKPGDQDDMKEAYMGDGVLINSGPFNGLSAKTEGRKKIIDYLVDQGFGTRMITYKLRDWVFSRQRYWGEPIPLVHCKKCGIVPVPEDQLPVKLPDVEEYQPTGTGESPLAAITEWVNTTCPQCGGPAKRETNTMPQWAGSCWYFLRYPNPHLTDKPFDQQDMHYWLPVDLYVGGIEHAILHLLYARFYIKVLYDLGFLSFDEPFAQLFNQGMVLKYSEKSGLVEKMSKSKGNVVSPDEMVEHYGSDALRMYMLFMGPPELDCEWQDAGIEGIKRFLNRVWTYLTDPAYFDMLSMSSGEFEDEDVTKRVHRFLRDYQERIDRFKPNTAISAMMEFFNDLIAQQVKLGKDSIEKIIVVLSAMAPHMASELLEKLLHKELADCQWPTYDPLLVQQDTVTIVVQVNGKMRANLAIARGAQQEDVADQAQELIMKWLADFEIVKIVFVPDRLINFVVR
jgi:leucyl-tRNA synthetase